MEEESTAEGSGGPPAPARTGMKGRVAMEMVITRKCFLLLLQHLNTHSDRWRHKDSNAQAQTPTVWPRPPPRPAGQLTTQSES